MKRAITILLTLLLVLSLVACGGGNQTTSTPDPTQAANATQSSTPLPTDSQDSTNEEERKTLDKFKNLDNLPTVNTVIEDSTYLGESDNVYLFGLYSVIEAKTYFDKYISAIEKAGYTCQIDDRDGVDYGYWIVKNGEPLGAVVLSYYDYAGTGIVLPMVKVILF